MSFSGAKQVESWAASGSRRHFAPPEDERMALQGRVEPECGREETPMWEAKEANSGTSERGDHSKQRIDEEWTKEWTNSGARDTRQLEDLATWGSYMKEELDQCGTFTGLRPVFGVFLLIFLTPVLAKMANSFAGLILDPNCQRINF